MYIGWPRGGGRCLYDVTCKTQDPQPENSELGTGTRKFGPQISDP